MEKNLSRIGWREAATGGLYAGLVYAALSIVGQLGRSTAAVGSIAGAVSFFSLAGFLYFYARRMTLHAGADGFSYGQCLGFILKMSLFAGILSGIGQFVLVNWIDPQGFEDQFELMVANVYGSRFSSKEVEAFQSLGLQMMKNPLISVLSGIFSMVVYGGLLGLLISAFVKRPADPFAGGPTEA